MRTRRSATVTATLALATLFSVPELAAQSAHDSGERQSGSAEVTRDAKLPAVQVTAQHRAERLEKVPVAVTALDWEFMQDAGLDRFEEIEYFARSFESEYNTNPFVSTFRIRGLGNLGNIPNFEPDVGLFVDGAYRSRSGIAIGDLLDIERIEVLRGPQSVLYPKNVSAGLVNLITREPGDVPSGYARFGAGNHAHTELGAGLSGPFSDALSAGVSIGSNRRDGSFDDLTNDTENGGFEQETARAQMVWEVSEAMALRLIAGASKKDGACCSPDVRPGAFSTALLSANDLPFDSDPFNRVTAADLVNRFDGSQSDFLLGFDYDLGWARWSALSSYDTYDYIADFDAEQSALDVLRFVDREDSTAWSQELRLTSNQRGRLDWMLGAYYYRNEFVRGTLDPSLPMFELGQDIALTPIPGAPGDSTAFRSSNDSAHWSMFLQGGWQISERFKLSAGTRWIDERKEIDVRSASRVAAAPSLALVFQVPSPVIASRDTDDVAWNLSAQFVASSSVDLYASVARGFKAGGFNGDWDGDGILTPARREFGDETLLNTEVGLKGRFLANRATLNVSVFDTRIDDFQNASFLGTSFLVRNAEQARVQGAEIEGVARAADWLLLNYSLAYLDSEYEEFRHGPCAFGNAPDNPLEGTCDLSGNEIPNAPSLRSALGAQFERSLGEGRAYLRIDWTWTADHLTDATLDERSRQDDYGYLNLRLGWIGERWRWSLWGENLSDETVILVSGPQTLFGGIDGGMQFYLADPRTYGVSAEYRY